MSQKLNAPTDEAELRTILDRLYQSTRNSIEDDVLPSFKGLLEVAISRTVIISAIHKIKANKGSKTAGTDNVIMQDILSKQFAEVIDLVQTTMENYKPKEVRRVYIPKPGNKEKRSLGIPALIDRIIQECIRMTIEPILEAQFFKHSYGFRPMRDAKQAVERAIFIGTKIKYNWVVEGDIKGFFDNVNHNILIKQLWHMGIRDRRILMIIKEMLKAGIMNEIKRNELGTPQGGIISPLLANVYLHKLDEWVSREWEDKELRNGTKSRIAKLSSLRNYSSITRPEFFLRYADDWVLFTNSKENAEKWKYRIKEFLNDKLKLELSDEKTYITNMKKKPIKFLGFRIKMIQKGNGHVGYSYPDRDKLEKKFKEISKDLKKLKFCSDEEWLINDINVINSKFRGIINYYNSSPGINLSMRDFRENLKYTAYKSIKKYGGDWIPANQCQNLKTFYPERTEQVPAVKYKNHWIGFISLSFATCVKYPKKNQDETPYSVEGRELYFKRSKSRPLLLRTEALLNSEHLALILAGNKRKLYTYEYFMNRCNAFNRDKGKCSICRETLTGFGDTQTHHIDNKLPFDQGNKVPNLATTCNKCHTLIHAKELTDKETFHLKKNSILKLHKYRKLALRE
ncbi:group II intron reverse transcriptase/maturase [Neobacillus mesonae]|uniref:Group II intron reverse transcriptase/maturase n=1 Tax=Neobacillus mesonae TaxID=1193713 RepID=A0A3Q9QU24_9BACI|nr:group II intron reverse transcriptase/maturase [Neobacillus mesonae]AZU61557.1 group II intron reverse transcriptase/maturase [Neobacillus mesonae]